MAIAVATTTWYGEQTPRSNLALQTIRKAAEHGYHVAVVDGGSYPDFCSVLQSIQGVTVQQQEQPGMGASRRQVLTIASELAGKNGVIFWTEPEKVQAIDLIPTIVQFIVVEQADITILNRKNLDSYPPEQILAEKLGNMGVKHITGLDLDFWSGIFAINQKALPYFLQYDGKEYGDRWESLVIPRLRAMKDGLTLQAVEADYVHDPEQTKYETGNMQFFLRRIDQLALVKQLYQEAKKLGLLCSGCEQPTKPGHDGRWYCTDMMCSIGEASGPYAGLGLA